MRIKLRHEIVRRYEPAARSLIQLLRTSPRNHEGQHVFGWRIDLDRSARLAQSEDAFGNISHAFNVDGPVDQVSILVEGEIETQDTAGIVRGAIERLPPALFLRQTEATRPSAAIVDLAAEIRGHDGADALSELHALLRAVNERVELSKTAEDDAAATALERGESNSCGLAHVFLAAARQLGHPARYISGYVAPRGIEGEGEGELRAWAEAFVERLGWVAFDPVERLCATDAHIRIATALDRLGAAPLRCGIYGLSTEHSADTVILYETRKGRPA